MDPEDVPKPSLVDAIRRKAEAHELEEDLVTVLDAAELHAYSSYALLIERDRIMSAITRIRRRHRPSERTATSRLETRDS
jgi:hypothetical protein